MKILFAADFYTEFELYETEDPADLIDQVTRAYFDGGDIDTNKHRVIGFQETMTADEAREQADRMFFASDEAFEECQKYI